MCVCVHLNCYVDEVQDIMEEVKLTGMCVYTCVSVCMCVYVCVCVCVSKCVH